MIKVTLTLLAIFIMNLVSVGASAQEISCDAFCLTDVRMDTSAPNIMYVTLFFSGDNDDFINYPWISEIINDQGDTVGVGTLNFFGQIGNTSNDYSVTVEFDAIPDNFNATMVFHYDTSVCLLNFPCSKTGIEYPIKKHELKIFPNPFSSGTTLYLERGFHDLSLKMFDLRGQLVKQIEPQSGFEITLNRGDLLPGIYYVQLSEGKNTIDMRKLVIMD